LKTTIIFLVHIDHQEVTVYPDDDNKPALGEELNIPARITLLGIYPIDRSTREVITNSERIRAMHYTEHLSELTKKFDGDFVNYNPTDGSWTFTVESNGHIEIDESYVHV
jgi:nuclear pore complex protein Nup98-Nup96